ncbi:restriction endonuclease subunit S [Brachybacterium tyrofermentans]|uniref:restriction endonuclease subunit S n=1 Tax=Brachybacterium tyrofermentans TaxID=47848 RepID=UPI003FD0A7D8
MTDWDTRSLGSVATLQRGFDLPTRLRRVGTVPIVSSSGTSGWHDRAMVKAPGVVTGRYGTVGEVFYQEADFWPLNTTLWVSNFHANDERFVYYMLQRVDFATHSGKSGVPGVNRNDLHTELVSLPRSTGEQRAIAAALADSDDLIATTERLIAKKQAIKQGMMQQLLTGKTRLPGFTEPWREASIGEVANVDPEALTASTDPRALIEYISLEDVERGEILGHTRVRFGSAPSRARRVIKDGDVLFGTVRPNLQSHAIYRGGLKRPIVSTGFAVIRAVTEHSDAQFLFYALMSHLATVQVDRIIAGSNYPAVSSGDVRRLTFTIPPIAEQRMIGSVLADCDGEVLMLKRQLAKTLDVKQGMMQQLLTGRTRLPAEDTV